MTLMMTLPKIPFLFLKTIFPIFSGGNNQEMKGEEMKAGDAQNEITDEPTTSTYAEDSEVDFSTAQASVSQVQSGVEK
jgi:hypothetical protein